jgi:hypothetical protein
LNGIFGLDIVEILVFMIDISFGIETGFDRGVV